MAEAVTTPAAPAVAARLIKAVVCSSIGTYQSVRDLCVKLVHGKDAKEEDYYNYQAHLTPVPTTTTAGENVNVDLFCWGAGGREPPSETLLAAMHYKSGALVMTVNPSKRGNLAFLSQLFDQAVVSDYSNNGEEPWSYYSLLAEADPNEPAQELRPKPEPGAVFVDKPLVLAVCTDSTDTSRSREATREECEQLAQYWHARYVEVDLGTLEGKEALLEAIVTPMDPSTRTERLQRIQRIATDVALEGKRRAMAHYQSAHAKKRKSLFSTLKSMGSKVVSRLVPSKAAKKSVADSSAAASTTPEAPARASESSESPATSESSPAVLSAEDVKAKAPAVEALAIAHAPVDAPLVVSVAA